MRILHVHSGNLYGGVETMLRSIARDRSSGSHHQSVFALSYDGRIARELRQAGAEVHIIGEARASQPLSVLAARGRIAALCRNAAFDATIVHSIWALVLLAPGAVRPFVLYRHDLPGDPCWARLWSRCTRPDLVIANSRFTAARVAQTYGEIPLTTIHPCVELSGINRDADSRLCLRSRFRTPASSTIVLQASRFEPWKGHALLLEALSTLKDHPDWVLWIAGAPQRPAEIALQLRLQAAAQSYGMAGRVVFLGHVENMPELMRAADIYCQPNIEPEPFGIAFVEALHAGLTVVATALGGANEILLPHWGITAGPTAASVAEALRRCLDDEALRTRLSEAGPQRALELCNPPTQIEALENTIRGLRLKRAAA